MGYEWLSCDVSSGMFPDEKAVSIETTGMKVSLFLPAEKVRFGHDGRGEIQVQVVDWDERSALVALPDTPIEGQRMVKVPRESLKK
jgi:hypothetical protein